MASKKVHEKVVALFDVHDDPFKELHPSYKAAKKFLKDYQPDRIVLGGDIATVDSISYFVNKKPRLAEGRRYKDDVNSTRRLLRALQKDNPNAEFDYIIGNHEYRVQRYIDEHPAMEGSMDWVENVGLEKDFGMNVVEYNKVLKIGKAAIMHGWYYNIYHAAKTLKVYGDNIFYGHVHEHQVAVQNMMSTEKPIMAMSVGCLSAVNPDYRLGMPTRFQNGLLLLDMHKDGTFTPHHIIIINGVLSYGGQVWRA
jgi:predicted MPP superfamily phosphohydrolase